MKNKKISQILSFINANINNSEIINVQIKQLIYK